MKRSQRLVIVVCLLAIALGFVAIGIGGPSVPPAPRIVVVDAGHGGEDPGAIDRCGVEEKDITLAVARLVQLASLGDSSIEVILTRNADVYVELADRTAVANRTEAALFVSLHVNAYVDPDVRGVETYYDSRQRGDGPSARLAGILQERVVRATGARDRGVRTASLFLTRSKVPAALVEMGFLTHPEEGRSLQSLARQQQIATAVYEGIRAFLLDED